ncbi:ABC transporter ATP-binding protein [Amycolatopsis sp. DG1A-15b]|uniref:ABC transporter ATP-binding protein n=1 Tax=Amycolatopsis sp. DG1A-15b TaxID=3052846 RepID=UPI00255B7059|nr:ABC transporter ATP-binding protein [Amycolatopsis sp. DG1A-15b]WIX90464.1 ABC transporter ATP-binding protein [Amycolatopsis sp. DG1A-15b]
MTTSKAAGTGTEGGSVFEPSAWRDLLSYIRPYRGLLVAGGVLSTLGSLIGLVQPVVTKQLIDSLSDGKAVTGPIILLTGAVLLGALISTVGSYLLGRSAESVVRDSRRRLVGRILWLRIPQTAKFPPGDLMSRVTADTTLLREVASQALVDSGRGLLMFIAILTMMFLMDPVLVLVTLGVLVFAGILIGLVVPFFARYNERVQTAVGEISSTLERSLGAFRMIKAAGLEPREEARAVDATTTAWKYGVRLAWLHGLVGACATLAIHVSFLAVLGIGGARVATGQIEIGTLVAFLLYLFYLLEPVGSLLEAASNLSAGLASARRIREVQQLEVEPKPEAELARIANGNGFAGGGPANKEPASVSFREVAFRYPGTEPLVHQEVTFEVPPGGITALVGPSGAGKSTVFALLERFYEPDGGRILLDGHDVRDWPLYLLRAAIGYVEQDAPVLAGTLRENLLIGVPHAEEADIERVLQRTRLDRLVAKLPDGIDTAVGHRGNTLSGGERQRVAVARALLRRPRLLLLDEVTSQLDAVNELALRETVAEAARELTVVVVAHRLSTVVQADRIVVLDAGRVRAVGTHHELIKNDPLYNELATTQLLVSDDAEQTAVG